MTGIHHNHATINRSASQGNPLKFDRNSTPLRQASTERPPTETVKLTFGNNPEPPKKKHISGKAIALTAVAGLGAVAGGVMIAAAQPLPEVQMESLQRHERMAARDIGSLMEMGNQDGGGFWVPHHWTGHDVKAENPAQVLASMRDGESVKYLRGEGAAYVDVDGYDELGQFANHYEKEQLKQDMRELGERIEDEAREAWRDFGRIFQ